MTTTALARFLAQYPAAKKHGSGYRINCPAHDDRTPSLDVDPAKKNPGIVICCRSGCTITQVLAAMNWTAGELYDDAGSTAPAPLLLQRTAAAATVTATTAPRSQTGDGAGKLVAVYRYPTTNGGGHVFEKGRFERADGSKHFRWRPAGAANWEGLGGVKVADLELLGADEVRAASPDRWIYFCEGEKARQACVDQGLLAVTAGGGASTKNFGTSLEVLRNRRVRVFADNDGPGREYMAAVHANLRTVAADIQAVSVPLPPSGDAFDFFAAGGTVAQLETDALQITQSIAASPAPALTPRHAPVHEIIITDRQLPDLTAEAMAALVSANGTGADAEDTPVIYLHGGHRMVRARSGEGGRTIIEDLSEAALRGRLARSTRWVKATDKGNRGVPPPMFVVKDVASLEAWPGLPDLMGIVEAPVLRPDGTVLNTPGYDRATQLLYQPAPNLSVPDVSEYPTEAELEAALALLRKPFAQFPFVNDASRANAHAAQFTLIMRPAIDGPVPIALFDAPQSGTGKGLLIEVLARIVTGRPAGVMTAPDRDADEWRKMITATLLRGPAMIIIDNIEQRLDSPHLAAVLTIENWESRILGSTAMVTIPHRAVWFGTGNNIRLGGDLPRRAYWIQLNAQVAHPWERTGWEIEDLRGWVTANRGELLWAILTLCRGWYAVGCPKPKTKTPVMGGFESWCETVGGVLHHYGLTSFLGNQRALYESGDEEGPAWEAFLTGWREIYSDASKTVAQITADIRSSAQNRLRLVLPDDLVEALENLTGKVSFERRLGNALKKRSEKRYGHANLYVTSAGTAAKTGNVQWRVRS